MEGESRWICCESLVRLTNDEPVERQKDETKTIQFS